MPPRRGLLLAAGLLAATASSTHAFVPHLGPSAASHQVSPRRHTSKSTTTTTTMQLKQPFSLSTSIVQSSPEYSLLKQSQVLSAATGRPVSLGDATNFAGNKKTIVAFFTHFGDFNAFELGEKLLHYLPALDRAGVNVVAVGIGTVASAQEYARLTGFPLDRLYADEEASAYGQFGFSRGFLPDLPVNPYLKLLPMLAGIGSPGTLQAVLRGYVGDKNADASWTGDYLKPGRLVDKSRFDVLGTEGARPFEVATVRLQNMIDIIPNWEKLSPPNKQLITQQGGTLVFEGRKLVKTYKDKGILTYTDVNDLLATVGVAAGK